jgi:hypothetical protein
MHVKAVKEQKQIKLDKLNITIRKEKKRYEKYCLAIKRQIAKLSSKFPSGVVILSHPDIAATR